MGKRHSKENSNESGKGLRRSETEKLQTDTYSENK